MLQDDDELIFNQPHTVSILLRRHRPRKARAVTRAAIASTPIGSSSATFAGAVAAEVVDAIGDGSGSVLAAARAPTLRHALARLTADLAAAQARPRRRDRRGSALASAFDLVIEIARLRDGRARLVRLAELTVEGGALVPRDIFTFAIERTAAGGAIEGSLPSDGNVAAHRRGPGGARRGDRSRGLSAKPRKMTRSAAPP